MSTHLTLAVLSLSLSTPTQRQDDACLDWHAAALNGSTHEDLDCRSCQLDMDLEERSEEGPIPTFSLADACGVCHHDEWDQHSQSVHRLKFDSTRQDEYPLSNVMFYSGHMTGRQWPHRHARFLEELEDELTSYRNGELSCHKLAHLARQALKCQISRDS